MGLEVSRITWEHKETVVSALMKCCADEIVIALAADPVGCVFCNLRIINVDYEHGEVGLVGELRVVREGVSRAIHAWADAWRNTRQADIAALVRIGVANELAERRDERIEGLRGRKPEELLPGLWALVHRNPRIAAVLLDHLTTDQRSDLKVLLHDQISNKPVIYLRMDREPEEVHRWVYWYLYHSQMAQSENKRAMGGIPMYVLAIRRGAVPTNKAKEIVFPLAPMYAHVYKALGPELKKWGYRIKHPNGVNRIAKSLGVSHATVKAWLEKDVPVKIQRNGKGGVDFQFTLDAIVHCIEVVAGKKRGRKPKQS
jgi:hypothetical protein